jgi:uncharacterized membrane protein YjgN (DUF898 family)
MQSEDSPAARPVRRADPAACRIDTGAAFGDGIEPFAVEFSGSGGEYFRVWIVNLLLNIVTLGFYTPFARRRTAQYFYGHTQVGGSPLEFTAQQRKMVFGFLLLVAIYVTFKVAANTGQDTTTSVLLLAGAALAPYFWGSAMRFRLGATRWRGVRLQFTASWSEVYKASWPVFAIALTWIAALAAFAALAGDAFLPTKGAAQLRVLRSVPLTAWLLIAGALVATFLCVIRLELNYKSLLVSRARIGGQAGRWKPVYGDFVRIWLATLGVFVAGVFVFALVLAAVVGGSFSALSGSGKPMGPGLVLAIIAAVIAFLFGILFASAPARAYRQARMFQLVWNNVGVSLIARFKCKLRTRRFVLLRLKNMFLTLLTLGFYRPFAMVSEYRMKTESVTLHVKGGLDQLVGELARQQDGIGDAIADAVGLDLVG